MLKFRFDRRISHLISQLCKQRSGRGVVKGEEGTRNDRLDGPYCWATKCQVGSYIKYIYQRKGYHNYIAWCIIISNCVNNKILEHSWLLTALIYALMKLSDLTCPSTNICNRTRQIGQLSSQ